MFDCSRSHFAGGLYLTKSPNPGTPLTAAHDFHEDVAPATVDVVPGAKPAVERFDRSSPYSVIPGYYRNTKYGDIKGASQLVSNNRYRFSRICGRFLIDG